MKYFPIITLGFALMTAVPSHADPIRDAVAADLPSLVSLYRELHAQPELSRQEVRTAAKLAAELKAIGFDDQHMFQPPFGYYDRQYTGFVPYDAEKRS